MELKEIDRERKMQRVSWAKLAKGLPISGDGLNKAFQRGSVDEIYLDHIIKYLKLNEYDNSDKKELSIVKEPDAIWVNYESFMAVPLVGKRAQAGFLSGWGDDEYIEDLPTVPFEVNKEYKGKYMAFEVSGDSMDDNTPKAILEGDILLCREVQRQHWVNPLHINKWNFIIVHKEEGILVKRIIKHDVSTGDLTLHSLNPFYDDFTVNMNDLIAIFNVVDLKRKPLI